MARPHDLLGLDRGGVELGTERCQRVGHGIGDRCRRCDSTAFAHSFDTERVERRRRMLMHHHYLGHVASHHVVRQRAGQQLALRVIGDALEQDAAKALAGAAGNLAFDQQKVILCFSDAVDGRCGSPRGQSRD
jgi:hypothetical protein